MKKKKRKEKKKFNKILMLIWKAEIAGKYLRARPPAVVVSRLFVIKRAECGLPPLHVARYPPIMAFLILIHTISITNSSVFKTPFWSIWHLTPIPPLNFTILIHLVHTSAVSIWGQSCNFPLRSFSNIL